MNRSCQQQSAPVDMMRSLLGLNAPINGCSYQQHECCGKALKTDDVIKFKLAVVEDIWASHFLHCWVSGQGSCCIAIAKNKIC